MTTGQIQSFLYVVETQSFNKAEKKAYLSRQAIKKQIDALEAELGFHLFVRTHLGTTLTPVGKEFYQSIRGIYEEINSLVTHCQNLSEHEFTLRVGSPAHPRLILEKAFAEFSRKYPFIRQNVIFINEAETMSSLLSEIVDVAECILTDEIKSNRRIDYLKLADLPYNCILSVSHPLANRKIITVQDLNGNTIGIRHNSNDKLIQKLKAECRDITLLESGGSDVETQKIFTICYNNGIFLLRAYYSNFMAPLLTIPFDCDITAESCIIFLKNHSKNVQKFIDVVSFCRVQTNGNPARETES